jgi:hypothetical protein
MSRRRHFDGGSGDRPSGTKPPLPPALLKLAGAIGTILAEIDIEEEQRALAAPVALSEDGDEGGENG